mmetsp:Transcript_24378/g.77215  ORF Transcript_24378/g.77215 Transcript_24378/m.77215 type:complete len:214 (-) Transcript_24378:67-708(-)
MPDISRPSSNSSTRSKQTSHPPVTAHTGSALAASRRAPTKKMAVTQSRYVLRPHRSVSAVVALQPSSAPSIKMDTISDQRRSLDGSGMATPSGVSAAGGIPSAARSGLDGVFMLPRLYPHMTVESMATAAAPASGREEPPVRTTGDSCAGISEKLSDRLASDTTDRLCTTRCVRPGTATYARSASDDVREKPPTQPSTRFSLERDARRSWSRK